MLEFDGDDFGGGSHSEEPFETLSVALPLLPLLMPSPSALADDDEAVQEMLGRLGMPSSSSCLSRSRKCGFLLQSFFNKVKKV